MWDQREEGQDHVHGEGVDERAGVRHGGERAEDVGHHRSPPGTQLDELHLPPSPGVGDCRSFRRGSDVDLPSAFRKVG